MLFGKNLLFPRKLFPCHENHQTKFWKFYLFMVSFCCLVPLLSDKKKEKIQIGVGMCSLLQIAISRDWQLLSPLNCLGREISSRFPSEKKFTNHQLLRRCGGLGEWFIHLSWVWNWSIDFDIPINPSDKDRCSNKSNGPTKNEEANTKHQHVTKIECSLKETRHFRFDEEIINGIEINITSCRTRREERNPLPTIILSVEQKIGWNNCHTDRNNDQDDVN